MPDNSTTALVKTTQSPALARVSSQLALTDKLLAKKQPESDISTNIAEEILVSPVRPNLPTKEEFNLLTKEEQDKVLSQLKNYNQEMEQYNAKRRIINYTKGQTRLSLLLKSQSAMNQQPTDKSTIHLDEQIHRFQRNINKMKEQLMKNSATNHLIIKNDIKL